MDTSKNVPQEGAYIQVVWYIRGEHVLVTEKCFGVLHCLYPNMSAEVGWLAGVGVLLLLL